MGLAGTDNLTETEFEGLLDQLTNELALTPTKASDAVLFSEPEPVPEVRSRPDSSPALGPLPAHGLDSKVKIVGILAGAMTAVAVAALVVFGRPAPTEAADETVADATVEPAPVAVGARVDEWLEDLAPIGTDWNKPFLEVAPYLIVVFKRAYELGPEGKRRKNYYVEESVGLACGFLLAAIHQAGLVALTHTPSPMNFLTTILGRPENERPFLLIPVGKPAAECRVPALERKALDKVMVSFRGSASRT